jgi:subtilisin family serine protease
MNLKADFPHARKQATIGRLVIASVVSLVVIGAGFYFYGTQQRPDPLTSGSVASTTGPHLQIKTSPKRLYRRSTNSEFSDTQLLVEFQPYASQAEKSRIRKLIQSIQTEVISKASKGYAVSAVGGGPSAGQGEIDVITIGTLHSDAFSYIVGEGKEGPSKQVTHEPEIISAIQTLRKNRAVKFAQPSYIYSISSSGPDDDMYRTGSLWNMYGDGLPSRIGSFTNAYGSQAEKAWSNNHVGSRDVYVGVIDTGADATHPDLAGNLDLKHAMDYIRDPKKVDDQPFINRDENGHGTHVAGIIGAIGNNTIGVAGVNWKISIIPIKAFGANGKTGSPQAIKALQYLETLREQGINVVAANMSWANYGRQNDEGVYEPDYFLLREIKNAARMGILSVAAASDEGNDNDQHPAYPASFDTTSTLDGSPALPFNAVISVAAINQYGGLWSLSNYGAKTVDLAAPGVNIVSTIPPSNVFYQGGYSIIRSSDNSTYVALDGTSQAAPHVTGAVALYWASHPQTTARQAHDAILQSAIATPSLKGKTATGGRLDVSQF